MMKFFVAARARSFYWHFKPFKLSVLQEFCFDFSEGNIDDEVVGEVSVQVDLFTQAGSGEHKVTVKGDF